MFDRAIHVLLLLVVSSGITITGCSFTSTKTRTPEIYENKIQNRDAIVVAQPENPTKDLEDTFKNAVNEISHGRSSSARVRSFPEMDSRIQRELEGIFRGRNQSGSSGPDSMSIPYSQTRTYRETPKDVFGGTNSLSPDADPEEVKEYAGDRKNGLILAGRIDRALLFTGSEAVPDTNYMLPENTGVASIWSQWGLFDADSGSQLLRFSINDRVQFDLSGVGDEISRLEEGRSYVSNLLRRVAWKAAARIIPHQYHTYRPSTDHSVSPHEAEQMWESD